MLAWMALAACNPYDDSDTDTDVPVDTDVTVDLRVIPDDPAAFEGATLGLFRLDGSYFAVTHETPTEQVALGADGAFTIGLTPDVLEPAPWAAEVEQAGYALIAYVDDHDASGFRGIARLDAVYLTGAIPTPYTDIGLHVGWNAFAANDEGPPVVGDPLAIPLEANLVPLESVRVEGEWDGASGDVVGAWSTEDPSEAVGLSPTADSWSVTVYDDDYPAPSTIFSSGDVDVAGFRIGSWIDPDYSGTWTEGDTATGVGVNAQDVPIYLAWGAEVQTAHQAHVLVTRGGFREGWSAVYGVEGSTPIPAGMPLRIVPGTPWP